MTDRVLWLTKGLGLGGAERLLTVLATSIDPDRFEVEVAYLLPWKDAFVAELEAAGCRTICLGARRTVDPRWVGRLRRLLAERDYALIHTHSPVPAAAARLLGRSRGKLVHTEHNVWDRYRLPTRLANAVTFHRNDAVIAVSEGVAASITTKLVPGRLPALQTLHHGIDTDGVPRGQDARAEARERIGLDAAVPTIGTVANFTPKKDHAGLLDAFDHVRREVEGAVLVLIGSGPLQSTIEKQAAALGLRDQVRFLGARDDVAGLLPALDVFALGSRFEGLPISLLEAMAAEVPCVATDVGGVGEVIVDGRTGRLVPAGDPRRLAAAMVELLWDAPARRAMAVAGREHVRERFSSDRAAREIEAVYTRLLTP